MVVWYAGFLYGYHINPDTPPLFLTKDFLIGADIQVDNLFSAM
jgi:hypothetical protein